MNGWSCSLQHGPPHFTVLKKFFIWMVWSNSKTLKLMAGPCSPKHGPFFITVLKNLFACMLCSQLKHSSLWLGRAPQHPLLRPSSLRGVEKSFRFDVAQTCKNVKMEGLSCSPKHSPAHFPVLKNFFVWMVWSFSKTFKSLAWPCSPKHSPLLFTVLNNLFVWMLCSQLKTFKIMAGPRSPTPPSQPNSFRGVEETFRRDVMQTFNNVQMNRWSCFSKVGPAQFTILKKFFVRMVWSVSKTFELKAWPCSPKHGPVLFTVLENVFVWMLCSQVRAPPNTAQFLSRCWKFFLYACYAAM